MKRSYAVLPAGSSKKICKTARKKIFRDRRRPRRLPAEVLLNIVHCVDYNTLVALCFTSHTFHNVVQSNAGKLAKRRQMRLDIKEGVVILCDSEKRVERWCDPSMPFTYVAAMWDVAPHVRFHSIATLSFANDWRRLPMNRLLYALPALRFAETLRINFGASNGSSVTSVNDVNEFTAHFSRLCRVQLYAAGWPYFDWHAFLYSEGARKLPRLLVDAPICNFRKADGSVSQSKEYDFLQYCFDYSRLADGVARFLKLPDVFSVSRSFLVTALRRIAKAD